MDIKEALKKGVSEEELRKTFNAELASAQEEMKKDQKTQTLREESRKALITAVLNYCKACGASETTLENLNCALQDELPKLEKTAFKNFNLTIGPLNWHHLLDWFNLWL